jgi:hypothetical protein
VFALQPGGVTALGCICSDASRGCDRQSLMDAVK